MTGGEPPLELWYAWQNKRWGMTPAEVDATEAGLLTRMAIAWDAYENAARALSEFKSVPAANKAQWLKDNPEKAAEWARRSGLKGNVAAWYAMQREKRVRVSG